MKTNSVRTYLGLLESVLTGWIYPESWFRRCAAHGPDGQKVPDKYIISERAPVDEALREAGKDWPSVGYTMIGHKRLANIRLLVSHIVYEGVPGDLIECGVWKGGACIWMKALLEDLGDLERTVFVADSFQGLPQGDRGPTLNDPGPAAGLCLAQLAVAADEVRANFARFGLLDERVRFIEGWFKDTLPGPVAALALLRIDADMYESTLTPLRTLYDKVSRGGFVVIDEYLTWQPCHDAVNDFFKERELPREWLVQIDDDSAYWRKP